MAGKKLKISSGFALKKIDLKVKSLSNNSFLGNYTSAFKGTGLEFDSYRNYNQGSDDASKIDWKASRRVNDLLVRKFKEERNFDIIFLVDSSSQMITGTTKSLKAEYAAELVSTLSQSVIVAGDSVGFNMFSDKIVKEFVPARGLTRFHAITEELAKVSNYGGYSDIDKAIEHAFKRYDENSLVILVSDFVKGIRSEKLLKLASKKFDLILVMVRDPIDLSLPKGKGEVFLEDPYSGTTLLVAPDEVREKYSREVKRDVSNLRKLAKKYGADFLFLETNKPYVKELIKFFKMREEKWR